MRFPIVFSIALLFLAACQPNGGQPATDAPWRGNQLLSLPVVVSDSAGRITTADGKELAVPMYGAPDATVFYLLRHTEKDTGDNPALTNEGVLRAHRLGRILEGNRVDGLFSTNYRRTMQTAQGISPFVAHPPFSTYIQQNQLDWVAGLAAEAKGKTYVIVGHSNTIPALVNHLLGKKAVNDITDDDFGQLFVLGTKGPGRSEMLHLRFE